MKAWLFLPLVGLVGCGGATDTEGRADAPSVRALDPAEEADFLVGDNDMGRPQILRVSATKAIVEPFAPALEVLGGRKDKVLVAWANGAGTRIIVLLQHIDSANPLRVESALVATDGGPWRTLARATDRVLTVRVSPDVELAWVESRVLTSTLVMPCDVSLVDFAGATLTELRDQQCGGEPGVSFVGFPRTGRWAAYQKDGALALAGTNAAVTGDTDLSSLGFHFRAAPLGGSSVVFQERNTQLIVSADGNVRTVSSAESGVLHGSHTPGRNAAPGPYVKRESDLFLLREDGSEELVASNVAGLQSVFAGSPRRIIGVLSHDKRTDLVALREDGSVEATLETGAVAHRGAGAPADVQEVIDVRSVVDTDTRTTVIALVRHSTLAKLGRDGVAYTPYDEHLVLWTSGADGRFVTRELARFDEGWTKFGHTLGVGVAASGRFVTYGDALGAPHRFDVESLTDTPLDPAVRWFGPQVTVR